MLLSMYCARPKSLCSWLTLRHALLSCWHCLAALSACACTCLQTWQEALETDLRSGRPWQAAELTAAEEVAARRAAEAMAAVDAARSANQAALKKMDAAHKAWQAALRHRAVRHYPVFAPSNLDPSP